jgi:hypothetical protein
MQMIWLEENQKELLQKIAANFPRLASGFSAKHSLQYFWAWRATMSD